MIGSARSGASNRTGREIGDGDGGGDIAAIVDELIRSGEIEGVGHTLRSSTLLDLATGQPQVFAWGPGWPNVPGKVFVPLQVKLQVSAQAGTHVANPSIQSGTNANVNNFISGSGIAATSINQSLSVGTTKNNYYTIGVIPQNYPLPPLDGGAGPSIYIAVQATAGCVLRGYLLVSGYITTALP